MKALQEQVQMSGTATVIRGRAGEFLSSAQNDQNKDNIDGAVDFT